jgi:1,5-anhydro-D-fructose reductase (1,5-anhydro-D-mannitol-forming)
MAIGIGIIGLGTIGRLMMAGVMRHPEFELVAVFDPQVSELVGDDYAGVQIAASAEELMAHPELKLVYIATPPATHQAYCRLAITRQKAIWCEKPLGVDLADCATLVREVADSGLKAAINLSLATSPVLDKLKELLERQELGNCLSAEMRFHFSSWPRAWQADAAGWLSSREQGGFMREVVSHFVFLHHRLFGPLTLQGARVRYLSEPGSEPGSELSCEHSVMAEYHSGDLAVRLSGSVGGVAPDVNEWTLYGDRQSVKFHDWNRLSLASLSDWKALPLTQGAGSIQLQLDEMTKLMAGQPHRLASFAEALAVQRVIEETLAGSDLG